MKLPNWFKVAWWVLLTGVLTWFLYFRSSELLAGNAVPADIVVFVIWVALLLAPLFSEVSLLGITLKQQVDELKAFVALQVSEIRNDVRNTSDARASVSQQFTIPQPAPDAQLPAIEAKIRQVLSETLATHGFQPQRSPAAAISAPEDVAFLFAARYNIERELRRIAENRQQTTLFGMGLYERRPAPISQLTRELANSERIDPQFAHAIKEVYAVCSPAIHGESVSAAQIKFVRDVAPDIVATLKTIQ